MPFLLQTTRAALLACAVLPLAACSKENSDKKASAAPPTPVSVVQVRPETLPVVSELPGRVASMITADVRPRVTGLVLKRVFEQGAGVKEGDLLYLIDPAPFQAKVDSAQAAVDSAIAARKLASQKSDRQTQLQQRGVTSADDSETAIATLAQSNAEVSQAEANLRSAQLDLQYTQIKAPITGTIGRALITEGTLVSPTSDVMATIQQIDPIYADFTQPADTLILLRNAIKTGQLKEEGREGVAMKLVTEQGSPYPHEGKLLFSEASVNAQTGQLILRGEFPNPEHNLLPGMYVRSKLQQGSLEGAFAVPEQAVQRDTAGKPQLYIVDAKGKVEVRNVTLGWIVEGRWVVVKGLAPEDRVVVEGFQKFAPGAVVKAEPWPGTASTSSSAEK
ncbi:efflux RND transporter periplasmic adaptor subunit [Rhizobium sp. VS19-DR104.2]|uniref:efflux RND transporter periplasmic adaptor subunit n=1 Tax=unclassified Rhizobium TaxID=2613769 RepID=UPI001C5A7CEC|nr:MULTISPECIES: efflux RND transporter periplasmic adaptor subunit [unclassified Rhizobium]MBZ5763258.1 efflux RND transporter periplasmic adaptor subunit [Rhizobium sp. VS19-DR96]MBZ5769363.1 efflux RND transporter periplasmic adaptor subunit [Rhizobium sp. VS19-DR129.2]MBZ5776931.1 efflux RND transporter periplasmic adaptor subunit [Rhizobium sp. VS19-DRK62.2]MBZ5787871.1 efflux RND transporter periplasmic adaptor subunit [Rhizobium sp. VS19-DR121]MBZ5805316.1 efflux RND transporter peripla